MDSKHALTVLPPDPSEPDELTRLVRELDRPETRWNPRQRAEICRRALALTTPEQGAHRLELRKVLGDALLLDSSASRPESLEEAIELFRQVLADYPPEIPPHFRARTLESLGNALRNRLRGPRAENLEEAIERYRDALALLDREHAPDIWALLQGTLGMAWSQRWLRDATAADLNLAGHAEELLATTRTPTERTAAYTLLRRARARPDLCPYSHPYYWAGYVLSGDPGLVARRGAERPRVG